MLLEIKNINKSYGSQKVLCNINESFDGGRIVGLLGPNGAGKSTLMKIITGYITADNGTVSVDGQIVGPNNIETKKIIGYLPEHNPLYLEMYVREYLDFVASIYGIRGAKKTNVVAETIEKTGLDLEKGKKIGQLSKGYRQRVGIAAAIMHNPKLLILDEPTTGLDPNQLIEIRSLIKDLGKDRLVIFSTHIMQEVEMICDDIIMMNHGYVVVKDTKDNLLQKYGSLEEIFKEVNNKE